jgi:hypothetical protein
MDDAAGLIQINFPREWSATIAELAQPGQKIRAEVEPEETHGHPAHPVYRLLSIKAEKKTISLEPSNGDVKNSFKGKVERLNYALHGEVNGAILDTGDFLHVKPHGAASLNLEVGMSVKGSGHRKPMVGGHRVIEAEEVNGIHLEKKPKKKAPHKP